MKKFKLIIDKKRGFTLIELIIVILIIAVISSAVLIELKSAKEKAVDNDGKMEAMNLVLKLNSSESLNTNSEVSTSLSGLTTIKSIKIISSSNIIEINYEFKGSIYKLNYNKLNSDYEVYNNVGKKI